MLSKEKLEDWYIQAYFKLTHLSIRRFWENVRRWFSYYKILRKIYDDDYSSLLVLERNQLLRLKNAIINNDYKQVNWEYDIKRIELAIHLLDIIEEDGCAEIDDFDNKAIKQKWILPKYVNISNICRFMNNYAKEEVNNPEYEVLVKDALRVEKAWHLYHRLRIQYMRHWWI